MAEILVTLDKDADITLLRKMIENMKGVLRASVRRESKEVNKEYEKEWIQKMRELSHSIDPSIVDMSDERTRYLMSK